jgi:hypothetical protein
MELNLSKKGRLSIKDAILIDKIAPKVQDEYNKLIEQLINTNALSELDLLLSVTSRNPFHSLVLPTLCKVFLLEEKLKRGDKISLIIVENALMLEVIYSILAKFNQKIPVKVSHKFPYISLTLSSSLNFIKSVYLIIISWLWPRLTLFYRVRPKTTMLFVDNFVFPSSFTKEGFFFDRYYTGYEQYLNDVQCKEIWYSPTLFGFKTLGQHIKMSVQAKKSKHNFIFQESWLTFYDYIYAFYLTIVLPFKVKKSPLFMGHKIHQLLISEARRDILSPSLVRAICKYRFIGNLRKAKIEICQAVDWHENQTIDKALNLGFHKYYPDVIVKGYQGHVSSSYETHKVPQSFELENSTLPNQLHVISEDYKKIVLGSCPSLDVRVASAFRFSYLYDVNRSKVMTELPLILIALPMDIDESVSILNSCTQLQYIIDVKVSILVKHHPGYDSKEFVKRVPVFLNDAFIPTDDSMLDLLESTSLLISSASSVCVEAASLGIPVAIHGNRYGVTMNPVANTINNTKGNVFYSQDQLGKFVDFSLQKNNHKTSIEQSFFMDNGESAQALFVCE